MKGILDFFKFLALLIGAATLGLFVETVIKLYEAVQAALFSFQRRRELQRERRSDILRLKRESELDADLAAVYRQEQNFNRPTIQVHLQVFLWLTGPGTNRPNGKRLTK